MDEPGNQRAMKALANPIRRQIVELLRHGEVSVNGLVERFDVTRPGISRHLRVLREAGLVRYRACHKTRFYSIDAASMENLRQSFDAEFRDFWRPQGSDEISALSAPIQQRIQTMFKVSVSTDLAISAQRAYQFCTEEEYFKRWAGRDARNTPKVGGSISATSALGGKLVAEYLALDPGKSLMLRVTEPLDPRTNHYFIHFEPTESGGSKVKLCHFVEDKTIARLVETAWVETWKLLRMAADQDVGLA